MKKIPYKLIRSFLMVMMIGCAWTTFAQAPVITSFSPVSAKPGDVVTLTGTNFNITANNNIVFFGATRATVTAASAMSVTVIVPSGATYAPLTLLNTATSLVAFSVRNFTPTYSPVKTTLTTSDFQAKQDFTAGTTPYSVALGDLDGDGKPELVVVNYTSNTVSVYRNTSSSGSIGSGSFAAKVDFLTGTSPYSVAIGDVDGDGKPDLAVANVGSNTVSVYRNMATSGSIGTGSFAAKVDFTTGTQPVSVALGDLDGDGKPDLAVANNGSNTVSVFRNTATSGSIVAGSFAAKVDFTTGTNPRSVAIGDLDGDGKPDLAVVNFNSATVSVYRNTSSSGSIGAGSFAAKVDFTTGSQPYSVALGDLDGDGKPDLVVANYTPYTVSIFRNISISGSIGNGSFAAKVDFATGSFPVSVDIGDLDGDGKPDLAVANNGSNTVSIFRNISISGSIGNGSFAAKVDFTTGSYSSSVDIGDLDGDSKPDLAIANGSSNTVSVLRNADIPPPTIISFSPFSAKPGDVVTLTGTNFNTTSANNIVFLGATRASVTAATAISVTVTVPAGATYAPITLLNTSISLAASSVRNFTPTYSPVKTTLTASGFQAKQDFATGAGPYSVAVGDLDGDGKPDLAVVNFNSATVSVYRNTSSSGSIVAGSFATKVDFTTGAQPYSVAIGDVDGDGKPDLAVANVGSNTVSVYRNMATSGSIGTGSFAAKVDFTTGTQPISVALGDLDGDGKPELAVANAGSNSISVIRNTATSGSIGSGSFAAKVDFTTETYPISVAIGDLDGDGKLDLAVANYSSNTVSVFRNTATSGSIGAGSFAAKVNFATGSFPYSVALGDFDGDGKPELATANYGSNTVSVIRNTATSGSIVAGSFAAKVDFITGTFPVSVDIGDLDGDGKPELATANSGSATVSVIRNTSSSGSINSGSFAAKVDLTTGSSPRSIAVGDLDGDGRPELAVANQGSSTVSVLRNADFPPVITSFSPTSAKPGDVVTLTGTNFNSTPANNIVFFGATRASVTAATAISITVIVPSGATYAPITLLNTTSGLAASNLSNFTPTYSPAKTALTTTDFQAKQDFATGTETSPSSVAVGDLDGDGKPELVVANFNSATVSVYRNTSSSGSIVAGSFAAKVDFTTGTGPYSVTLGDLDGDGKLDLAIANYFSNSVSVIRNLSSSGSIDASSFVAKVDFAMGSSPVSVAIGDLDGDGKPDLAVANISSATVSVFRNTATSGSIGMGSFAAKVDFATGTQPISVALGDLNGDGKPELAVANYSSNTVSVFRNTSTSGSIVAGSFAAKVDFATSLTPYSVAIGDLDGDGKPELAVANGGSATVSVFRNTVTSGSIVPGSFATKVDFATGTQPQSVALGDLDGDGKPELATANSGSATVSVIRNTAISGSIVSSSFAAKVDFATGTQPYSVALGDLDGDGKPDLAVANYGSATVSVLRNRDIVISITNGAWNDPNTWNVNRIPLPSESVIIDQNHTVDITTAVSVKGIEYKNNAKLSFTNASAKLNIGL